MSLFSLSDIPLIFLGGVGAGCFVVRPSFFLLENQVIFSSRLKDMIFFGQSESKFFP